MATRPGNQPDTQETCRIAPQNTQTPASARNSPRHTRPSRLPNIANPADKAMIHVVYSPPVLNGKLTTPYCLTRPITPATSSIATIALTIVRLSTRLAVIRKAAGSMTITRAEAACTNGKDRDRKTSGSMKTLLQARETRTAPTKPRIGRLMEDGVKWKRRSTSHILNTHTPTRSEVNTRLSTRRLPVPVGRLRGTNAATNMTTAGAYFKCRTINMTPSTASGIAAARRP